MDEMIETVRAALLPDADEATKARAATIVRSVLALLEPIHSGPDTVASSPGDTRSGDVTEVVASVTRNSTDTVLDFILERLRAYLPREEAASLAAFQVRFIRPPV